MTAMSSGDKAGRQGLSCTNAHVQPPKLVECHSAKTGSTFVVQVAHLRQLGAEGDLTTSNLKPDFAVPMQIITIKDKHLGDTYIMEMLRKKGLTESQIASIRTGMRQYIDSFLKDGRIELDSGGYRVLTNMLIHLIEESSKE